VKLQKSTSIALCSVLEAASDPTHQISAAEIVAKYGVSAHHLAKVLRQLSRSGFVESTRGAGGGYRFIGNAKRLTLYDVIEVFEDVNARTTESGDTEYGTDVGMAIGQVLEEIDETAKATFRSITISTLLKIIASRKDRPPG